MAINGSLRLPRLGPSSFGIASMRKIFVSLFWLSLALIATGCATSLEYGRWPDTSRLAELRLGQSDSQMVLDLLGEPTGKGEGRMPDFPDKATVWSYEYQSIAASAASEVEINLLMVFLKDGIYQGHFWFAADDNLQLSGVER